MSVVRSNHSPRRRVGFTLIEMVTSMIILAVILLACGSIVMMAGRATTDGTTRITTQLQVADAASQLQDDLNVATNFTVRTAKAATFTVPDRLNTGSPQVVSYSWSGGAGDSLYRQFNGGTATPILTGVQNFALTYNTRVMGPSPSPTEQTIASHLTISSSNSDNTVDDKNYFCECFAPSLSSGASTYTITRIGLYLKTGPQNSLMNVSLQLPNGASHPSGTIIASTTLYDSAMSSSYELIDIPITGATGLNPLQNLCIVITPVSGYKACGILLSDSALLSILSGCSYSASSNSGGSWTTATSTTCPRFYVMGTVP